MTDAELGWVARKDFPNGSVAGLAPLLFGWRIVLVRDVRRIELGYDDGW
jgi:hypothetical protein